MARWTDRSLAGWRFEFTEQDLIDRGDATLHFRRFKAIRSSLPKRNFRNARHPCKQPRALAVFETRVSKTSGACGRCMSCSGPRYGCYNPPAALPRRIDMNQLECRPGG